MTRKGTQINAGDLAFGVRSVPWDAYTFLETVGTALWPLQSLDGDVSSGVWSYRKSSSQRLAAGAKHGLITILDISKLKDDVKFQHNNLAAKGVVFERSVVAGPNGSAGGCNYLTGAHDDTIISVQVNMAWVGGGTFSSTGQPEVHVTNDGQVFQTNDSFVSCLDVSSGKIVWETQLANIANSQVGVYEDMAFLNDTNGNLYVLDAGKGDVLWKQNGVPLGMNGGIAAPGISSEGDVVWINNYSYFGFIGAQGPNGAVFKINPGLIVDRCSSLPTIVDGKTFVSWDTLPKISVAYWLPPSQRDSITHSWQLVGGKVKLNAVHGTRVFSLTVDKFKGKDGMVLFDDDGETGTDVVYDSITFINETKYRLDYTQGGLECQAWLA